MKKILIALSVLTLMSCASTPSDSSGDRQPSQVTGNIGKEFSKSLSDWDNLTPIQRASNVPEYIINYFLSQANKKNTEVSLKIDEVRKNTANEMIQPQEGVPQKISQNDIIAVRTFYYYYPGKVGSSGEVEDSEDQRQEVEIFVPFINRYYGGRITEQNTARFLCSHFSGKIICKSMGTKYVQNIKNKRNVAQVTGNIGKEFSQDNMVQVLPAIRTNALIQIMEKNSAGNEATKFIKSIVEGQDYYYRVSIMKTECFRKTIPANTSTTCSVTIGVDDLKDDDNGWGTIYRLDYVINKKGTVLGAALTIIAG